MAVADIGNSLFFAPGADSKVISFSILFLVSRHKMLIPIPAAWTRQPIVDPNDQIDRALLHRQRRLMAGLSVDASFRRLDGALIVCSGHGKFLRLIHSVHVEQEIPEALASRLAGQLNQPDLSWHEVLQLNTDLAEAQAALLQRVVSRAGKYLDRVLAVAVSDPGISRSDFDGRPTRVDLCHATRLAELSGMSVIDALPQRDLEVEGSGQQLDALPIWLVNADRGDRVSSENRSFINLETGRVYWLPASDGSDSELPEIQTVVVNELSWLNDISAKLSKGDLEKFYCQGKQVDAAIASLNPHGPSTERTIQPTPDVVRSLVVSSVERLLAAWDSFGPLKRVIVVGSESMTRCVINRLNQVNPGLAVMADPLMGSSSNQINSVATAILGVLHVDQMPGNVPALTGAESQRILGRLTPGSPANWRQLIRSMADAQPPTMKLRDAV